METTTATWTVFATKEEIQKILNSELSKLVESYEFKTEEDPFDGGIVDTSKMIVTDYSAIVSFLGRV